MSPKRVSIAEGEALRLSKKFEDLQIDVSEIVRQSRQELEERAS